MKHFYFAALAVVVASGSCFAQPPEGRGPGGGPESGLQRIMNFDTNGDGKISKEEMPERMQSLFARADKDEDGLLTKEEILANFRGREGGDQRGPGEGRGREGRGREGDGRGREGEGRGREGEMRGRDGEGRGFGGPGRMPPFPVMMALDADHDGEISADEINNATAALKTLDRNKDGKLDREELRPQFDGPPPGGGFGFGRGRGEGPPPGEGRDGDRGGMADFLLGRFDENKDGKLSKDEAPERMREMFASMDTNNDNYVDRAEMEQRARQLRDRGPGGPGPGPDGGRPEGRGDGEGRRRPPVEE